LISAFLQTSHFQRFLPCVESKLAKHCFSTKFGGNIFTKRSVGKIFLPNFVHALLDKYHLKPVAKNDDMSAGGAAFRFALRFAPLDAHEPVRCLLFLLTCQN
jgi:hypothetical protein